MQVTGDGFKTPHPKLSVERRIRMGVRPKAQLTELIRFSLLCPALCRSLHELPLS